MAKNPSFDIVSDFDFQELDNAINQTKKEIENRYDFKGSKSEVSLSKDSILLTSENDSKLYAIVDILQSKIIKRNLSIKILDLDKIESKAGGMVKQNIGLKKGLDQKTAKNIVKIIKDSKLKVQSQIQCNLVRVTGKSIDDLQNVIALIKEKELNIPIQFINYR